MISFLNLGPKQNDGQQSYVTLNSNQIIMDISPNLRNFLVVKIVDPSLFVKIVDLKAKSCAKIRSIRLPLTFILFLTTLNHIRPYG